MLVSLAAGLVAVAAAPILSADQSDGAGLERRVAEGWKWLHRIGIHYIWLIFTFNYVSRAVYADPTYHLEGRIMAPLFLAALGLRLYARLGRR
ncbi:hypothetical protein BWQ93_10055 [Sphingopyxis sp. QXT-31]|uniref:hypothetical protein n=1 Tax=Sphingopyxis sp. QXT-31 TaxID=1357916 RepID=UPI00097940E7|nr:hypothetical protein [Sphingopyxis sp. QXT-31]APZ98797.1 hypothetical protein BWQ93_10055 [Sphingopyxis sp. QXT-31]